MNKQDPVGAFPNDQYAGQRIATSLQNAIEAISIIGAGKVAGENRSPREETMLRAEVLAAVVRLQTELQNERESNGEYDEILSRWEGKEGYISRFRALDPTSHHSAMWLQTFARDIHRAGWELGYLKPDRPARSRVQTLQERSHGDVKDGRDEKVYGERTLQERADGYIQMNIPKQAVDDPKVDLEGGQQVSVRAVIEEDETYLKIEGVADE